MQNLSHIVKNCHSKADVLRQLKWPDNGAARKKLDKLLLASDVDCSHFLNSGEITNLNKFGVIRKYEGVDKSCPVCGVIFQTKAGHTREKTVCSRACANTHFRSGEQNGQYKHGRNGEPEYRIICFKYWNRVCAIPECGWSQVLDVHHIDGNHKNDSPNNLIPLCPNHHRLTTHGLYKVEIDKMIYELRDIKFADLDQR